MEFGYFPLKLNFALLFKGAGEVGEWLKPVVC